MKLHIRSKHERLKFKCNQCENQFKNSSSLRIHIDSFHLGLRYGCSICDNEFTSDASLKYHMKRKHKDWNKYLTFKIFGVWCMIFLKEILRILHKRPKGYRQGYTNFYKFVHKILFTFMYEKSFFLGNFSTTKNPQNCYNIWWCFSRNSKECCQ